MASNVLIDRAKVGLGKPSPDYEEVQQLISEAVSRWPENREAHKFAHGVAVAFFDDEKAEEARKRFFALGGNDSRYYFSAYELTGESRYLDQTLEKYPAFIPAYIEKYVEREKDKREARFNFAVATQCVARSSVLDLGSFYVEHAHRFGELYGKDTVLEFLHRFEDKKADDFAYHLALYDLTKDPAHLDPIQQKKLLVTPETELLYCVVTADLPESQERLMAMKKQYGNRKTFQERLRRLTEE